MSLDSPEDRQSFNRHFANHLKPHSTIAIQEAIAEAVTRLTGGFAYTCSIQKLDYVQGNETKGASIELQLIRDTKKDDDAVKTDGERRYEKERREKGAKGK